MQKQKSESIFTLLKGVFWSAISIYIGYIVSGAIGLSGDGNVTFINALVECLKSPFDNYFNDYSPIIMILAFIIFEVLYFLKMLKSGKVREVSDPESYAPDIMDVAASAGVDNDEVRSSNDLFKDIFENNNHENDSISYDDSVDKFHNYKDSYSDGTNQTINENESDIEENFDKSFPADITTELISDNYSISQIRAMQRILKYIDIKSANALEKLFKVDMSAADISEYISIMYE